MSHNEERTIAISGAQLHDLKNRLTVIKGISQLLGRQVRRADWQQERVVARVDTLQQEIVRLEVMIDSLAHDDLLPDDAPNLPASYTDGK